MEPEMRALIFKIALIIIYSSFTMLRGYYSRQSRKLEKNVEKEVDHMDKYLLSFLIIFEVITFFLFIFFPQLYQWTTLSLSYWFQVVGAMIGILSILFFLWVHHSLGLNFTVRVQITDKQTLVQSGPYKYIRHPMYTAFILLHISVALLTLDLFITITWFAGLFALILYRLKKEEGLLIEKFGDEYIEYQKRTGSLFPKIF